VSTQPGHESPHAISATSDEICKHRDLAVRGARSAGFEYLPSGCCRTYLVGRNHWDQISSAGWCLLDNELDDWKDDKE